MTESIKERLNNAVEEAEKALEAVFKNLHDIGEFNTRKVLNALIEEKVGEQHFSWVTGYGHDDLGREKLDKVFAKVFNAESAIVRPSFASGTHVISCCLFGCLRPGDEILSVAGKPYDSLHEVIGIEKAKNKSGSLTDFGIVYKEIPLLNEEVDIEAIPKFITSKTKMVLIQRSKGYENRKSILISDIEKIILKVKKTNKDTICFVDNCFGEFTEKLEPTDVGADLLCGSLIKNIGGGIVPAGGYIAGNKNLVELSAEKLTAPGIAGEGGCMFDLNRTIFQGLFLAPNVVTQVLKGNSLVSYLFGQQGFKVNPNVLKDKFTDIVVAIEFGNPEAVKEICKIVQSLSPVNSYLTPIACSLPGYPDEVIMAGGTFIEGSTVELSCDAPMRSPYVLYWQGGINYFHTKYVLSKVMIPYSLTP